MLYRLGVVLPPYGLLVVEVLCWTSVWDKKVWHMGQEGVPADRGGRGLSNEPGIEANG